MEGKNFCHPGKNSKGAEIEVRRSGESNAAFSLALIRQTEVQFQTNCQWHGNCTRYFSVDETAFTSRLLASVGLKLKILHPVVESTYWEFSKRLFAPTNRTRINGSNNGAISLKASTVLASLAAVERGVQMKVLIVDDEPEICSLLEEFLSQRGYAVATATSGEEGISKFAVMKPDLVLLDIRMPDIDGLQVLKQIKQSDPQTGTIMITAIKDSDTVKQALTMGVNDYIVKPIDLNHLEKLLTSWQRLFAA